MGKATLSNRSHFLRSLGLGSITVNFLLLGTESGLLGRRGVNRVVRSCGMGSLSLRFLRIRSGGAGSLERRGGGAKKPWQTRSHDQRIVGYFTVPRAEEL